MKRNRIARRYSLKAKFKGMDQVEVTITDDRNNVQIELIPINFGKPEDEEAPEVKTSEVETEGTDEPVEENTANKEDK